MVTHVPSSSPCSSSSSSSCSSSQAGHLHAGCSKEVSLAFCSPQPVSLEGQCSVVRLCVVEFDRPTEEVADWDDRQRTAHWPLVPTSGSQKPAKDKVQHAHDVIIHT